MGRFVAPASPHKESISAGWGFLGEVLSPPSSLNRPNGNEEDVNLLVESIRFLHASLRMLDGSSIRLTEDDRFKPQKRNATVYIHGDAGIVSDQVDWKAC